MKKRNKVISLLIAASMLTVLPSASSINAEDDSEWILDPPCYNIHGELQYETIFSSSKSNEIYLPSEVDGIPLRHIDPIAFIDKWLEENSDAAELTVYLPAGVEIAEREVLETEDDRWHINQWPDNFDAYFILSDGCKLKYSSEYNLFRSNEKSEQYYDYYDDTYRTHYTYDDYGNFYYRYYNYYYSRNCGSSFDFPACVEDWEYDVLTDGNGSEYVKLTRYNGHDYYVNFPGEIDGIPVKAAGKKLFGDEEKMMSLEINIPETITGFDDDCFYGLHAAKISYGNFRYALIHDLDPGTPDYLSVLSSNFARDLDSFVDECHAEQIKDFTDIIELFEERLNERYPVPEDLVKSEEHIGNYPVKGAVVENYWYNSPKDVNFCLPYPDSITFIRQETLKNYNDTRIHIPEGVQILPSDFFFEYSDDERKTSGNTYDSFENIKFIPRDVYSGNDIDGIKDDTLKQKQILPEGVVIDDPFRGFHINDDNGRSYRIIMDKNDFTYYAHLIYEPHDMGEIPEEFMGFPVIDDRSDTLYASSNYITINENIKELSWNSFEFSPVDFPALKEKLSTGKYKSYYDALRSVVGKVPLASIEKLDILSKDIIIDKSLFYGCGIKNISFPGNASVGSVAFGNSDVETLSFTGTNPEITLCENAFYRTLIKDIEFPEKVKDLHMDKGALYGIKAEEITLPEGTSYIGNECFSNCKSLKKITVNGSPEVCEDAFYNCPSLEEVTFTGKPVISNNAFRKCDAIKNINIDPELLLDSDLLLALPKLRTINGEDLFDKNGVPLAKYEKVLENGLKYSDNSIIADKYLAYRVKKMVNETVDGDMTDMQKVKALHDKLCSMVVYDTENIDDKKNHTDLSAFLNDSSVCEGYARAFNLLLHEAGIESCYIYNDDHAWNIVNIGGHYFHIDSTWDDGDKVKYSYFMKNDAEIRKVESHSSWELSAPSPLHEFQTDKLPVCLETMGDVNGDGIVDAIDASAVLSSYARASVGDEPTVDAVLGDVNFSGIVDAVDASEILTQYAKASVQ